MNYDDITRVIDEDAKVISVYYKETLIFSLEFNELKGEVNSLTSCSECNLNKYCLNEIFDGDTDASLNRILCSSIFCGGHLTDFQYPEITEEEARRLYLGLRGRVIKKIIRK